MGRLRAVDRAWLRETALRLKVFDSGSASALTWLVPSIRAAAGTSGAAAYGLDERDGVLGLGTAHFCQDDPPGTRARELFDRWLRTNNRTWGLFDPRRPPTTQRDRVLAMPATSQLLAGAGMPRGVDTRAARDALANAVESLFRPTGWDCPQARVLVCDGPRMLVWFGYFHERPFNHRQLALLSAIVGPLKRRLLLEEMLEEASVTRGVLEAVLDRLFRPAYVISPRGRILFENAAGRVARERDHGLAAALATPGGPDPRRFEVTRVPTDATHYFLAVARDASPSSVRFASAAARYWGLTLRETEVLLHLARGASNRRIAAELGCAERTVEIHVSRILAKADAESRAELVAKLISVGPWGD